MDAVIEIHEIGKVVHAPPFNRFSGCPAISNGLRQRRVRPDLRVARHAGFGGRQTCVMRCLDAGMAVPAIDAIVFHVVFMTERNGLLRRHANEGHPGTSIHDVADRQASTEQKNYDRDRDFRDRVRRRSKELWHVSIYAPQRSLTIDANQYVIITTLNFRYALSAITILVRK